MLDTNAWVTVGSAAIAAAAALSSAALAQRAGRRQEQDARLWEQRSRTYLDAIRWLQSVLDLLPEAEGDEGPREDLRLTSNALPPLDLRAQVTAYASQRVQMGIEECIHHVRVSSADRAKDYGYRSSLRGSLRLAVESTILAIREELQPAEPSAYGRWDRFVMWLMVRPSGLMMRHRARLAVRRRWRGQDRPAFRFDTDEGAPD